MYCCTSQVAIFQIWQGHLVVPSKVSITFNKVLKICLKQCYNGGWFDCLVKELYAQCTNLWSNSTLVPHASVLILSHISLC